MTQALRRREDEETAELRVITPDHPPVLTPPAARTLLRILLDYRKKTLAAVDGSCSNEREALR